MRFFRWGKREFNQFLNKSNMQEFKNDGTTFDGFTDNKIVITNYCKPDSYIHVCINLFII